MSGLSLVRMFMLFSGYLMSASLGENPTETFLWGLARSLWEWEKTRFLTRGGEWLQGG